MDLNKAYLASVCFFTDKVIPNFDNAGERWIAYGALAAYKNKVDQLFSKYAPVLKDMGVIDAENNFCVTQIKNIGLYAFEKEPKVSLEIPVINKKITFSREDFESFINYLEQSEKG